MPRRARSPPRSTASPSSSPNRPCRSAPATRSSASSARRGRTPNVAVVSNPEFLREGAAIQDFKHPDRIVVGTDDARAREVMTELYRPLYLNRSPILFTDRRTAELIKYAANAFLATKITFINEIADLCEKVGADVQEVARGIGLDNRIGCKFLHAGPGYGGSCFPKDTLALIKTGQDHAAAAAHRRDGGRGQRRAQARHGAQGDRRRSAASLRGKTIAVLGLTFKPNTDDMRDAPSIPLITALQDMGAKVRAYDPVGMEQAKKVLPERDLLRRRLRLRQGRRRAGDRHRMGAVPRARPRPAEAGDGARSPRIVDLRNIYRPDEMRQPRLHL